MSPIVSENTIPPEPIDRVNSRYGEQVELERSVSIDLATFMGQILANISHQCEGTEHDERARTIMIALTLGVRGQLVMKPGTAQEYYREIEALHQRALVVAPTVSEQMQRVLEMA